MLPHVIRSRRQLHQLHLVRRGRHISEDIPALVRAAAAEHPELECVIAEPLGELHAWVCVLQASS